jgi:hypothetical protein
MNFFHHHTCEFESRWTEHEAHAEIDESLEETPQAFFKSLLTTKRTTSSSERVRFLHMLAFVHSPASTQGIVSYLRYQRHQHFCKLGAMVGSRTVNTQE